MTFLQRWFLINETVISVLAVRFYLTLIETVERNTNDSSSWCIISFQVYNRALYENKPGQSYVQHWKKKENHSYVGLSQHI